MAIPPREILTVSGSSPKSHSFNPSCRQRESSTTANVSAADPDSNPVTDSDSEVRFDIEAKPGVSNLLSILGAATGGDPEALAENYTQYGPLKTDTAEAVIAVLEPIQKRFAELQADPAETERLLKLGADKAQEIAAATLARARDNIGLLQGG